MDTRLGIAGRLAALFQDSRLTPLLALALLLAGLFAVWATPREEEPQIDVTMATVALAWPGASAHDVEQTIALPAERGAVPSSTFSAPCSCKVFQAM